MIFIDLLPYIGLLLLTLLIPKLVNRKRYMFFLFLVFFVFSGFRYGVGWDFFNYLEIIELGGWRFEKTEFLVRQLEMFCAKRGFTQLFFVVTSFFIVLFYFLMISKESENPPVSIFVFLCMPVFFLDSLTTVRFSLAVSMVFLSFHYGYKKQYVPYFILLFAAILTHNAALFGLLTIPFVLLKTKYSLTTNLIIFIACFVFGTIIGAFPFFNTVFSSLSDTSLFGDIVDSGERYMQDKGNANFSRTTKIFALINLINLFSLLGKNQDESDKQLRHYVTMFNIGCSIVFLFSFSSVFASRIGTLFLVSLLLIMPYYKNKSIAKIVLYSIFVFVFFYQLTIHANHPEFIGRLNCWLPYRMNFSF